MTSGVVFISYSHDSDKHRDKVLALSQRLRADGLETRLDRYVNGSPVQGWPRWMLDQLDDAGFVLVVYTETYYRRFRGHEESGKGKGADWEGALITQEIYDARGKTLKFVPVTLAVDQSAFIPEPLRGLTHYVLTSEATTTSRVWTPPGPTPRPVTLVAWGGVGKTSLVAKWAAGAVAAPAGSVVRTVAGSRRQRAAQGPGGEQPRALRGDHARAGRRSGVVS